MPVPQIDSSPVFARESMKNAAPTLISGRGSSPSITVYLGDVGLKIAVEGRGVEI